MSPRPCAERSGHGARLTPASSGPTRTCVGCRERDDWSVLLRVVAEEVGGVWIAVPDSDRVREGRGAWVHRTSSCLELAVRRRAFSRALRMNVVPDQDALQLAVNVHQKLLNRKRVGS